MALNKERKVLLGLLGSAGVILVADQVLLGPPQGASASQTTPAVQPPPAPAAENNDAGDSPSAALPLSRESSELVETWNARLSEATTEGLLEADLADPFAAVEQYEPEPTGLMAPLAFQQQHKLSSVMTGGDIGVAMINGKPVRIGQTIEGYRLISVDDRSAVFRAGDQTVRLVLPRQSAGGS